MPKLIIIWIFNFVCFKLSIDEIFTLPSFKFNSLPIHYQWLSILLQHVLWSNQYFCCDIDILLWLGAWHHLYLHEPFHIVFTFHHTIFLNEKKITSYILISWVLLKHFGCSISFGTWLTYQTWNQQSKIFCFLVMFVKVSRRFSWVRWGLVGWDGWDYLYLPRQGLFCVRRSFCSKPLLIFPRTRSIPFSSDANVLPL